VQSDIELIREVKNCSPKSSEALSSLIKRHSGIFISVINNICPFKSSIEFKDLIADKDYYIYRSALKFEESRGVKFCTFLGNEAKWLALNLITYKNKHKTESFSFEKKNVQESLLFSDSRKANAVSALREAVSLAKKDPDKRVRKIFEFRYLIGEDNKVMPWKKIAKKLDLSIQGCINIHNSFITKIKNKIL